MLSKQVRQKQFHQSQVLLKPVLLKQVLRILSVLLLLCAWAPVAGAHEVRGVLVDSATQKPLAGARILLTQVGTEQKGDITSRDGAFVVKNIDNGSWQMQITYIGYDTLRKGLSIQGADLDLGAVLLKESFVSSKDVIVDAAALGSVQKGDTVEMNAKAFKTAKDASAEDLVQKMPGITMQDGKVHAQGEQVRQVLVDGRQFFGDDPNTALKNLPAEMIDKVQVFDQGSEQSRFTGSTDPNGSKTLNIVTKRNMRNGSFGRVYGGYGDQSRYKLGTTTNLFNDDQRITILGQSNNINEQNFAVEDLVGTMGGGGGGNFRMPGGGGGQPGRGGSHAGGSSGAGGFRGGGGNSDFQVDQRNGITTTHAAGLNYSAKWGGNVDAQASYFFNYSENEAEQTLLRQFVLPNAVGQAYDQNTLNASTNTNHRVRGRFEFRLDSLNSFVLTPRATAQFNNGSSLVDGFNRQNDTTLSTTNNTLSTNLNGYSINNDLLFRHAFATPGRTFSTNVGVNISGNDGTSGLRSVTNSALDTTFADSLDQSSVLDKYTLSISPNITYAEPLTPNSALVFAAEATLTHKESDRQTSAIDRTTGVSRLDTALTSTFNSTYNQYAFTPSYRWADTGKVWGLEAGVAVQRAELSSDQTFPTRYALSRTFFNVLPNASIRWSPTQSNNLRMNYRARTSPPSVEQLQDVINNSNPLQLSIGNSALEQDESHSVFARYSANDAIAATSFFVFANATMTNNYVANSVTVAAVDTVIAPGVVLPRGGQFTKPVNIDGQYSVRSFAMYGFPLPFISCNLNINGGLQYTSTPGLINGVENRSNNPTANVGLSISSNISEEIDFTISSNLAQNSVRNTVQAERNADYTTVTSRLRWNWKVIGGLVWSGDLASNLTSGYSAGYNQNVVLLNTSLAYKFMENDRAEVRLLISDALAQNTNIQRTVYDTYVDDIRSNLLQRYALLTFTYNFRNFAERGT